MLRDDNKFYNELLNKTKPHSVFRYNPIIKILINNEYQTTKNQTVFQKDFQNKKNYYFTDSNYFIINNFK